MKRFLCFLLLAHAAGAQTAVRTFDTLDNLLASDLRTITSGRKAGVNVNGKSAAGDYGAARFAYISTNKILATNTAHVYNSGNYQIVFPDRESFVQDSRWFGTKGDGITDDAAAINAAADYCTNYTFTGYGPGMPKLLIPATTGGYRIASTVWFRSSVSGGEATFNYVGPTNGVAVLVGPADADARQLENHTFELPNVMGPSRGWLNPSTGIRFQNLANCMIIPGTVRLFGAGWEVRGTANGLTTSTFSGGTIHDCKRGILWSDGGYGLSGHANGNVIYNLIVNNFCAYAAGLSDYAGGSDTGNEILSVWGGHNGNSFLGGSWEGFPSARIVTITNSSAFTFSNIRFEHHFGDFGGSFTNIYMQVHGDSAGLGIDNHFRNPSQLTGLYGVSVKETGYAAGNNGASYGEIYRIRGQGLGIDGLRLESSSSSSDSAGSAFAVYPYTDPTNLFSAARWQMRINPAFTAWKGTADAGPRLRVYYNGQIDMFDGASVFPSQSIWRMSPFGTMTWWSGSDLGLQVTSGGFTHTNGINFYTTPASSLAAQFNNSTNAGELRASLYSVDDGGLMQLKKDPVSKVVFIGTAPVIPTNHVRPATVGTQGGLELVTAPTNKLIGFYHRQRAEGEGAFVGNYHLLVDTNGVDYGFAQIGGGAPDHSLGWLRGTFGIAANWSSGSKESNIVLHTLPQEGRIEMRTGPGFNPAGYFDQSTNAGGTRFWLWVINSNAPVQVKYDNTSRVFYGGDSPNLPSIEVAGGDNITVTPSGTNRTIAVTGTLPAARLGTGTPSTNTFLQGQGAGNNAAWTTIPSVASPTNGIADAPADGTMYARLNNAWSGVDIDYVAGLSTFGRSFITGGEDNTITDSMIVDGTISHPELGVRSVWFDTIKAVASQTILGRVTAGSGDIEELTLGPGLAFAGSTLVATNQLPTGGTNGQVLVKDTAVPIYQAKWETPSTPSSPMISGYFTVDGLSGSLLAVSSSTGTISVSGSVPLVGGTRSGTFTVTHNLNRLPVILIMPTYSYATGISTETYLMNHQLNSFQIRIGTTDNDLTRVDFLIF